MDFNLRINDGQKWGIYMADGLAALLLGKRELVMAWNRETGQALWERRYGPLTVAWERA